MRVREKENGHFSHNLLIHNVNAWDSNVHR